MFTWCRALPYRNHKLKYGADGSILIDPGLVYSNSRLMFFGNSERPTVNNALISTP